jgi:hypothetical protein
LDGKRYAELKAKHLPCLDVLSLEGKRITIPDPFGKHPLFHTWITLLIQRSFLVPSLVLSLQEKWIACAIDIWKEMVETSIPSHRDLDIPLPWQPIPNQTFLHWKKAEKHGHMTYREWSYFQTLFRQLMRMLNVEKTISSLTTIPCDQKIIMAWEVETVQTLQTVTHSKKRKRGLFPVLDPNRDHQCTLHDLIAVIYVCVKHCFHDMYLYHLDTQEFTLLNLDDWSPEKQEAFLHIIAHSRK